MRSRKVLFWSGLLAALLIAAFLSPYASPKPDGLERVAIDHGFSGEEKEASWSTPVSGYEWEGAKDSPALATGVSGVIGVAVTFGVVVLLLRGLSRRNRGL